VTERDAKDFGSAREYFDKIFMQSAEVCNTMIAAIKFDPDRANTDLAYQTVRVFGEDETSALGAELHENAAIVAQSINTVLAQGNGRAPIDAVTAVIVPQLFLAFMAGYRHAVEEVELPSLGEVVLPGGEETS
jgi:hypothetical protein